MEDINAVAKKIIFSVKEVAGCFDSAGRAFEWLASRTGSRTIAKIKRDMYALINPATGLIYADKFMIASRITEDSYIAYHSALEFHGYANQVYNNAYVVSLARFRDFEYGGINYEHIKTPITGGVETVRSTVDVRVTDIERTVIDCIDNYGLAGGAEELFGALDYIKHLDEKRLSDYLAEYGKKNLYQKAGYVLSKYARRLSLSDNFFVCCRQNTGRRPVYFLTDENLGGAVYDKAWNIIAPVIKSATEAEE